MMGRLKSDQAQLLYEFHLRDAVPEDHLVRKIDAALDLSWLAANLHLTIHRSVARRSIRDPDAGSICFCGPFGTTDLS
jgi:hypothetical protein